MNVRLLSIEQGDKPLRFTEIGKRHGGLVVTIQPGQRDALARTIDMVNEFGGPNSWRIEEVEVAHAVAPNAGRNVRCTCGAEYSLMSNLRRHIVDGNAPVLPETAGYAHANRMALA
uniref:HNH endonuclease n=2 Tax=unclassified bacterial viruses TaxID=12333 RepID=A0AAU7J7Y4_9VIRU